jgi:AraC-like DNA-binding protein
MLFDDLSTKYIGQYVGYKTAANFYRNFRAFKSVTPEKYRQGNRSATHKISDEKSWSIVNYIYDNYTKDVSIHTC